jgi:hypothetical protein
MDFVFVPYEFLLLQVPCGMPLSRQIGSDEQQKFSDLDQIL